MVKQDFGYSATHFAGKAAGEIGGASSAPPRRLPMRAADRRPKRSTTSSSASGSFAITAAQARRRACFSASSTRSSPAAAGGPSVRSGWISTSRATGGRLAVRLITGQQQIVRHVHHAVPARQVPAHAYQERRHALSLDARLRSPGRRRATDSFTFTMRERHSQDARLRHRFRRPPRRRPGLGFPTRPLSPWISRPGHEGRRDVRPLRHDEHDESRRRGDDVFRRREIQRRVTGFLQGPRLDRRGQSRHV